MEKLGSENFGKKHRNQIQETQNSGEKFLRTKKSKKIVNKISTRKNILLAKKFHNVRDKILLIWRKKSKKFFEEKTSTKKKEKY